MSLLLSDDAWNERALVAATSLEPLTSSLVRELEPVVARATHGTLVVPADKALLSRAGGRCEHDGELLEFDPESPHEHGCPRCGTVHRGNWHDRFWPYWYQLWLAERAVHAAVLYRLLGEARHLELAIFILTAYTDRYLEYPNRDNVLGPSRPFFSTYLESIWLLQLVIALDTLEGTEPRSGRYASVKTRLGDLGPRMRDRLVEPSSELIASYDEGMSNRQVWNNAALLAARTLMGDDRAAHRAVEGGSSVIAHLRHALLPDGTWYEGENYHLFAHRGLGYSVTMLESRGVVLPGDLTSRFEEGFVTPFLTSLPDLTLPSRRDSQYAISLRQPRFAELCELGLSRRWDVRLAGMLHALYAGDVPAGDTGRSRSTADVERNRPGTAMTRADLGWRSLLHARPTLPTVEPRPLDSVLLDAQGIAVFRRDRGRRYVALDYGHSGGGHGHPDRLNLLFADGERRWLDDMGTGSYVENKLHWYRSTLAHNAPLVDGASQQRVDGWLVAHEERDAAGWVRAEAEIAPGVMAARTVVATSDYVLDLLEWDADRDVTLDLPYHVDGESLGHEWVSRRLDGADGLEDGFDFVTDTKVASLRDGGAVELVAGDMVLRIQTSIPGEWWQACAPGAPSRGIERFHLMRMIGDHGEIAAIWARSGVVTRLDRSTRQIEIELGDGGRHLHSATDSGWHIELHAGGARSSIDLGGVRELPPDDVQVEQRVTRSYGMELTRMTTIDGWLSDRDRLDPSLMRVELGEAQYVRSEQSWREAGSPTATVLLGWNGESIDVEVEVRTAQSPKFVAAGSENPYDNEPAEVNGDGIQLYVADHQRYGAWIIVPQENGTVHSRPISGWDGLTLGTTRWRRTAQGYTIRARVPLSDYGRDEAIHAGIDVIVNETSHDRVRRRGQLVLGGGGGFVYLRGDRHPSGRLVPLTLRG